jgi:hypothetical protein
MATKKKNIALKTLIDGPFKIGSGTPPLKEVYNTNPVMTNTKFNSKTHDDGFK